MGGAFWKLGAGKRWSLARSEVEPAPFSWGSQIVATRGGGGAGARHLPSKPWTGQL